MKQKKKLLYLSIIALLVLPCMVFGGAKLIGNIANYMSDANDGGVGGSSSTEQEISCVVGDSTNNALFDVRDLVRLERYFANESVPCSIDGDWNVSGGFVNEDASTADTKVWDTEDAEICFRMLVEDKDNNKQWQEVTTTESISAPRAYKEFYNKFIDTDTEFAYYTLNKEVKKGWVLTFKVDRMENDSNCLVSVYYPGCEDWLRLGTQSANESNKVFSVVATEDIAMKTLKIRVENNEFQELTSFRVYDIQIIKHTYVEDLAIKYDNKDDMPIVYGAKDTLDMTKFAVQSENTSLKYNWTLSYNGFQVDEFDNSDMESASYVFGSEGAGTYTLTAKVVNLTEPETLADITNTNTDKTNYSGEVSTTITVLDPTVYMNFNNGTIENIGSGNYPGTGAYKINDAGNGFATGKDAKFTTGIDDDQNGALILRHNLSWENGQDTGAYAVVPGYEFGDEDFLISTWFQIPTGSRGPQGGAGTYLFGISHPDGTTGFSLNLRNDSRIGVKVNSSRDYYEVGYKQGQWHRVALHREGENLKFYFDGDLKSTTSIGTADFETKDLAFGGYYGFTGYCENFMVYDDIQVYSGELPADVALTILGSEVKPNVEVNYNEGVTENTGTTEATVGLHQLNSDASDFEAYTGPVNYTAGIYGDTNGAIVTNHEDHKNGPYTVISGYELKENYTISTWFNVPDISEFPDDKYIYLFGTANPEDTAGGFSVVLKKGGIIQVRQGTHDVTLTTISDFKGNTWYHLVAYCSNGSLRFGLNGTLFNNVFASTNHGTYIAFGAYTGLDATKCIDSTVYFDNIKVFDSAITETQLMSMYTDGIMKPDVYVDYENNEVDNDGKLTHIEVRTAELLHEDRGELVYGDNSTQNTRQQGGLFSAAEAAENGIEFVTGYDGKAALKSTFQQGPYTVIRDYVFGKDNFTVSMRFNMIETMNLYNSANVYLFGTDHPDAEEGFSVGLKRNAGGVQQIRLRLLGDEFFYSFGSFSYPELTAQKWYQIILVREGELVKLYLDDILLRTYVVENHDFGTADLSFGGYPGFKFLYNSQTIHYDDVKLYEGALASGVSGNVIKSNLIEPDVEITYENGEIENTGLDRTPTVGAYKINATNDDFEGSTASYTKGIEGDKNGAIITNHLNGAYTVVDGYDFGTNDFTISTWVNIPNKESLYLGGNNSYIMGTSRADGGTPDGFGITLRRFNEEGKVAFKFYVAGQHSPTSDYGVDQYNQIPTSDFAYGQWHNLVVVREGNAMHMYWNGQLLHTRTLPDNYSFVSDTLSFGGYHSSSYSYHDGSIRYDDVRIYGEALKSNYIINVANIGKYKSTWLETARDAETTLFIGDQFITDAEWPTFDEDYAGKDVVRSGIGGSKIGDWSLLVERYLSITRPKNLVVHLGYNDIASGETDPAVVSANLQAFLTHAKELPNYSDTQIYYIGIPDGDITDTQQLDAIAQVNATMQTWCAGESRITYIAPVENSANIATALDNIGVDIEILPVGKIPEVEIAYTGGKIVNIGSNRTAEVGAYKLDKESASDNQFVAATNINFTDGIEGDANGAINTHHINGAYTVVNGYTLGTDNFTISTWFKIPDVTSLKNDIKTYLFGNTYPDDTEKGFAVGIKNSKDDDTGIQQIRIHLLGQTKFIDLSADTFNNTTWYHLALVRNGNSIMVYLDGVRQTFSDGTNSCSLPENTDFGDASLGFGGYPGLTQRYKASNMYYDNIQVYKDALTSEDVSYIVKEVKYEDTDPNVEITYTDGIIRNSGSNRDLVVGSYVLNALEKATKFVKTSEVTYTAGIDGDENGAISTINKTGAYTVVKDYKFGTDDFTISTWFKVPTGAPAEVASGAGTYLFGIGGINDTGKFSLCLRQASLRFKVPTGDPRTPSISYSKDTWNNLVLCRDGDVLRLYFNGKLIDEVTLDTNYDFGTAELAFGAFYNASGQFDNTIVHFDNIEVYDEVIPADFINFANQAGQHRATWAAKGNEETTLFVGDSFFSEGGFWRDFSTTYSGKNALCTGISSTTTYDWDVFAETYLAYTNPSKLVVHLGTNDIHDDKNDVDTVVQNLQALFTKIHALENYKDTKIYYFGIPYKKSTMYQDVNANATFSKEFKDTIDAVNAEMKEWCEANEQKGWITYMDDLTGDKLVDADFTDMTHLVYGVEGYGYDKIIAALESRGVIVPAN